MGAVVTDIYLSNVNGGEARQVEALVHTGATKSKAPATMLYELSVDPLPEKDMVVIGNDSIEWWDVGMVMIECQGKKSPCPIWFGPEDTQVLLGATSLEILGFKVNPIDQELESVPLRG